MLVDRFKGQTSSVRDSRIRDNMRLAVLPPTMCKISSAFVETMATAATEIATETRPLAIATETRT
jgi:hypothetical protein